jgi:hypothetical protein
MEKERKYKPKKRRKKKEQRYPGLFGFWPVRNSLISAEQSACLIVAEIKRTFWRHKAEVSMFVVVLFVPVMQRARKPFAFSNGKQVTVHRGPNRRTQSPR